MNTEKFTLVKGRFDDKITHTKEFYANEVAMLAIKMLSDKGLITAEDGGEDSQGRAKLRQESVEALVKRAFDIAELAYQEAFKRNLMIKCEVEVENNKI